MAYATRDDVLARAGALQDAFGLATKPSLGDVDSFLANVSAEIDARIAAHGFATPVADPIAGAALVGVAADKALLLALRARWPGGSGPTQVSDLIRDIEARVAVYDDQLAAGNLAAVLYLASTDAAAQEGGADSFWNKDAGEYDAWVRLTDTFPRSWLNDPWGIPSSAQPAFRRDERFILDNRLR